ncbi:interleukin 17 receptor A1a isoform X2 [Brienomyrus brachyistius]|uniref:interleukin 17 receptor A1a isoform X2 n=1 Tax=Brienomyrus brachyistius TaxID=42636 RepID=UPI0020B46171|nr:interleukin 17 receptor A1a isoform X2 [Brienomyrus brachyistius]
MILLLYISILLTACPDLLPGLRVLDTLNCTQAGLRCEVNIGYCHSHGWNKKVRMIPTAPQDLQCTVAVRQDGSGNLVPVVAVRWRTQLDGSMKHLRGTEVNMLKVSTNRNLCVRYNFLDEITPANKQWLFALDGVVVEPEEEYYVVVSNLPKPTIGQGSNNIYKNIVIPGCQDGMMLRTKACLESGTSWKPNIKLMKALVNGSSKIMVNFSRWEYAGRYKVFVRCNITHWDVMQGNDTRLKVLFDSEKFPARCCLFRVSIQPLFPGCKNDCIRPQKEFDVCSAPPSVEHRKLLAFGTLGVFIICVMALIVCLYCKKHHGDPSKTDTDAKDPEQTTESPRKVLIIYSLDHPLYKDVVLKLCAFLKVKCGTEVVLDLLDSTQLGVLGRLQWLECQMERIGQSPNKVLVLCSRGMQAKWRAMCGGPQVTLKEDTHSPMGDMLTPAFSLIMPDLLRSSSLGKYVVAYFEGICDEKDVPSPFRLTVKYKLMNHFEELYLRILGKEKLEPWMINHVEGIREKDYHQCPSGEALRDAIEAFQTYQLENPDWFKKECMENEEEWHPLLEDTYDTYSLPPEFREDPCCDHEMEMAEDHQETSAVMCHRESRPSVNECHSAADTGQRQMFLSAGGDTSISISSAIYSSVFRRQLCCTSKQAGHELLTSAEHSSCSQVEPRGNGDTTGTEEELLLSLRDLSLRGSELLRTLQPPEPQVLYVAGISCKPEKEEENPQNLEEQGEKRPYSGSDLGYISRSSLQSENLQSSTTMLSVYTEYDATT